MNRTAERNLIMNFTISVSESRAARLKATAQARRVARPDSLMLGGLTVLAATAVALSLIYSPFLSMFWRTIGGGA